jgi:hypothetical protein
MSSRARTEQKSMWNNASSLVKAGVKGGEAGVKGGEKGVKGGETGLKGGEGANLGRLQTAAVALRGFGQSGGFQLLNLSPFLVDAMAKSGFEEGVNLRLVVSKQEVRR